jgi:hypothetical protein
MLSLLHISDLHFGAPYLPKVGAALLQIAPRLKLDAILKNLRAFSPSSRHIFPRPGRRFVDDRMKQTG